MTPEPYPRSRPSFTRPAVGTRTITEWEPFVSHLETYVKDACRTETGPLLVELAGQLMLLNEFEATTDASKTVVERKDGTVWAQIPFKRQV